MSKLVIQKFTSNGSMVVPAGVTQLAYITGCGGGGSGSGSSGVTLSSWAHFRNRKRGKP
jgi:hypothetical protein